MENIIQIILPIQLSLLIYKSFVLKYDGCSTIFMTVMEYLCHGYVPLVVNTSRSFPRS